MPPLKLPRILFLIAFACPYVSVHASTAGFYLPDSIQEMTLRYERAGKLILLPVTINDTVHLNLILDTGCRNVILFGNRLSKHFNIHAGRKATFSGLGAGKALVGDLSLDNKVAIDAVLGERIPIVLVPRPKMFQDMRNVDGIIGYDIFIKFEIELHPARQFITFRPAATATLAAAYSRVPIRIVDSRPIVQSTLFANGQSSPLDIMIDTGSSLGLLLKPDTPKRSLATENVTIIAHGLNGPLTGQRFMAKALQLHDFTFHDVKTGVALGEWSGTSSIGMEILHNYVLILNYCQGYAGIKYEQE